MTDTHLSFTSARPLLWLVALAVLMQMLDATIINTALPEMAQSFGKSPLQMQAVVFSYSLAVALCIPASGWIADTWGTRRTFMAALLIFAVSSALCASATHFSGLIIARIIQGIGGAFLLPVGRLAVLKTIAAEEYLRALSFMTIPALTGPLIGPALGGWLTHIASWHWVFLINLPIGAIGYCASLRYMPNFHARACARFDLIGYILLAIAMLTLLIALDGVAELGMNWLESTLLFVLSFVSFRIYLSHARRIACPLFPIEMFRIQHFRIGILGNLCARIGSSAMPMLIPLLLQVVFHFSAQSAGLLMTPAAAAGMVSKCVSVRLVQTWGYRCVLITNTILIGASIACFAFLNQQEAIGLVIVCLICFGAVNSLQFSLMNSVTLGSLEHSYTTAGNSVLSITMMLSASIGPATAGSLIALSTQGAAHGLDSAHHALGITFLCMGTVTAMAAAIFLRLGEKQARD